MSEHIESSLNRLAKKHGAFTYNPRSSSHMYERKDSGVTKCSHFAVIREKINLPNDNSNVMAFKKCYDRLFREFKEKLVLEYA